MTIPAHETVSNQPSSKSLQKGSPVCSRDVVSDLNPSLEGGFSSVQSLIKACAYPECQSTNVKIAWGTSEQISMYCHDCKNGYLVCIVDPLISMSSDEDLYPAGAPYSQDYPDNQGE